MCINASGHDDYELEQQNAVHAHGTDAVATDVAAEPKLRLAVNAEIQTLNSVDRDLRCNTYSCSIERESAPEAYRQIGLYGVCSRRDATR